MRAFRRVFGVLTLLLAAAQLLVGIAFVCGAVRMTNDGGEWQGLLVMFAGFLSIFGLGLAILGGMLLLASGGVLAGKRWGAWLALFLSPPVASLGWFLATGSDPGVVAFVAGLVQLCYPAAAIGACVAVSRELDDSRIARSRR